MTCHRIGNAIVCVSPWGRVKLGNRYVMISFHEYCGPSFNWVAGDKDYDPVDENDPIWPLFEAWHAKYTAMRAKTARKRAAILAQQGSGTHE